MLDDNGIVSNLIWKCERGFQREKSGSEHVGADGVRATLTSIRMLARPTSTQLIVSSSSMKPQGYIDRESWRYSWDTKMRPSATKQSIQI